MKDTLKAKDKPKENSVEKWAKGLLEWDYKDYLFYMMLITKPSDVILSRCADLIELQMRKLKGTDGFALKEMATCIRVDATGAYEPLMPIPVIPGLNSKKLKCGYCSTAGIKNENFKETMEEFRRVSDCGSYDCTDHFYVCHVVFDEYGSGISGRELYGARCFADRKGVGV